MASAANRNTNDRLSFGAIMYLVHHVFLPPELPHKDDFNSKYETILLDTTIGALLNFKDYVRYDQHDVVDSVIATITNLRAVCDFIGTVSVSEENFGNVLRNLCKKGGTIPLYIRAQNAAVMISKVNDSVHVEAFEVSPLNQSVITTKGRLRRSFPGPAVSLSIDTFEQPGFQATMAHTLAKMAHQPAVDTKPKARKSGKMHDEDRDTTHPHMITELFMDS